MSPNDVNRVQIFEEFVDLIVTKHKLKQPSVVLTHPTGRLEVSIWPGIALNTVQRSTKSVSSKSFKRPARYRIHVPLKCYVGYTVEVI